MDFKKFANELYDIDIKSYYWPWLPEAWGEVKGYSFKVYMLRGKPRGFTCFKEEDDYLEIFKLAVHPHYRELGIGSVLLKDLVHAAISRRKKKLIMLVHEECKFFEWLGKRGWRAVSVERNRYPDGSDGYLFERDIVT